MNIQVTLLYAGILGMLLVILGFNITYHWVRVTGQGLQTDKNMRRAERLLSSFVEYVPLALVLMTLVELRGAPSVILHGLGIVLCVARLLHAYAMNQVTGAGFLRAVGAQGTYLVLMILAMACVYYHAFATL
ncbi:MAG: hypothetical protein GC131_02555 [Alphaproteobacteria bacterium]|nr:hypothetical protein [Alphaproteobacteria bacterium]